VNLLETIVAITLLIAGFALLLIIAQAISNYFITR